MSWVLKKSRLSNRCMSVERVWVGVKGGTRSSPDMWLKFFFSEGGNVPKPCSLPRLTCCQSSSQQEDTGGLSSAVEAVDEIRHTKCLCSVGPSGCLVQRRLSGWVHRSYRSFKSERTRDFVLPAGRELLWWGDILGVPGVLEGLSHVVSGGFTRRRKWRQQSCDLAQSAEAIYGKLLQELSLFTDAKVFAIHMCRRTL